MPQPKKIDNAEAKRKNSSAKNLPRRSWRRSWKSISRARSALEKQYAPDKPTYQFPWYYRLLRRFEVHRYTTIEQLLRGDSLKLIDVGGGRGELLQQLQARLKQAALVEVLPVQLHHARQQSWSIPIDFYQADISQERLAMRGGTFNAVVCVATLQYVINVEVLLAEVYRLLRPGGQLIIETANAVYFPRRLSWLRGRAPQVSCFTGSWRGGALHYFTSSDLRQLLTEAGFQIEKETCSGIGAPLRRLWPTLLGANLIVAARKK